MITKEQLQQMNGYGELHTTIIGNGCSIEIGPRGGVKEHVTRVRLSGKLRTWKRTPDRWEQPVKYGLYVSMIINKDNAHFFHRAEDCPIEGNENPE